jgi:hypothetical protein
MEKKGIRRRKRNTEIGMEKKEEYSDRDREEREVKR